MRCRKCRGIAKPTLCNEIWSAYECKCGNRFVRVKKHLSCYQNKSTKKIIEGAIKCYNKTTQSPRMRYSSI